MIEDKMLLALKDKCFDSFLKYDREAEFELKKWDFINNAGNVEMQVRRGELFEKVCISNIKATVTIPDRDYQSTIEWLGVQAFPKNPLVPIFNGVFEHVAEQGRDRYPAFFDIYPVVPFDEDEKFLKESMGEIAIKYGRKYPDLPEGYLEMFRLDDAGIGVGYGAGMALAPDEEDSCYAEDAANAVLSGYFDLVERQKDEDYNDSHISVMDKFRAEWVKFIFMENRFFSGGISLGIPVESFMLHMLPPSVKF